MLPQDRINALHELEKLISTVYSVAERDIYISTVAKKFGVEPLSIKADVDRIISKNAAAYKKGEAQKIKQDTAGYSDKVNPDFIKAPAVARNEENLLGLLLLYPEHRKKVFTDGLIDEDIFFTDLGKRIFAYIKKAYSEGDEKLAGISSEFNEEEMGRISKMKVMRMELSSNGDEVLKESIEALKRSVEKKAAENPGTLEGLLGLINKKRDKN